MAKKDSRIAVHLKKALAAAINAGLKPVEYSYHTIKKSVSYVKRSTPLIYQEMDSFISHIIPLDLKKRIFKKRNLVEIGDTIASSVVDKFANIGHKELSKIVKSKSSQSFIDMLARGLSISAANAKEYSVLSKEKKFKKVLIANRGEIALRVIRACRELGIETALVYSKHDRDTLAVKFTDKSYNIGHASSYLNIKKIIKIAEKIDADAIHPGYGFLAENAKFAKLCEKKGIKFIGPSPRTIDLLGNKVKAKKTVLKAGIPIIMGMTKSLKSKKHALKLARRIGFPVIIKAAAGGGGKGMRIVRKEEDIPKAYDSAETEAMNSFGNKTLYIERYIKNPRHIEFQILADQYGKAVHLGERECSIQRKHQKLIEESPSPALNDELREKMGAAAIKAVSAARYEGAGTVEFLLDKDKNFYFIEINTRIQVEHGVTEMVTGVDLVKEQIKLASGASLAFSQEDIKFDGWAIECRINAEDPLSNFVPSAGTIISYLPPGGTGIRLNSICHQGYKVLPHYDSLLSLLICHGSTRQEAIARMTGALKEYTINGIKTTIPFHLAVLNNENFIKGRITTSFIEKNDILSHVGEYAEEKKKELTKEQKVILIATAVSKYMEKKSGMQNKSNAWVMAGRQELMQNE